MSALGPWPLGASRSRRRRPPPSVPSMTSDSRRSRERLKCRTCCFLLSAPEALPRPCAGAHAVGSCDPTEVRTKLPSPDVVPLALVDSDLVVAAARIACSPASRSWACGGLSLGLKLVHTARSTQHRGYLPSTLTVRSSGTGETAVARMTVTSLRDSLMRQQVIGCLSGARACQSLHTSQRQMTASPIERSMSSYRTHHQPPPLNPHAQAVRHDARTPSHRYPTIRMPSRGRAVAPLRVCVRTGLGALGRE
ncbi:hypothetical protein L227DRAFT_248641 [Lentinus tigrinus ALCF2SS1-6]|uniref:Uncharacterized protein n=1 Tax=Lentinus tigrinus ALCF2SS1-6 TaxID=1328759 RepID=A0A5C2S068_9APHY|nr:hypothetical protein L227DRAFT_248641 [Lentinus tigrinus ALCF2SS1-6]